jgi:hypothetical protein
MFLGYETAARKRLTEILNNPSEDPGTRAKASLALARWQMRHGQLEEALRLLDAPSDDPALELEAASLAADCLCWLGQGRLALSRVAAIFDRGMQTSSTLIRLGSARSLIESSKNHGSGWLIAELNRLYLDDGFVTVSRRSVDHPPGLDNLQGIPPPFALNGVEPLISVIVPSRDAETTIGSTLESLLSQSWSNLEIVVVDAGSSDDTVIVAQSLAEEDRRIRVVTDVTTDNRWTALNAGLNHARGEYLTTIEDASWSHPQRIEAQALALLSDPGCVASGVSMLKVGRRDFIHRPLTAVPRESLIEIDPITMMYRAAAVADLGMWDAYGALPAEEYSERARQLFGGDSMRWVVPRVPLHLVDGELPTLCDQTVRNRPESAFGTEHLYREAYRRWHSSDMFPASLPLEHSVEMHQVPSQPASTAGNLPEPPDPVDAALVGDFGKSSVPIDQLRELVDSLTHSIGILHIPSFETGHTSMLPDFQRRISDGRLLDLSSRILIEADIVILLPSALFSFDHLPQFKISKCYLMTPDEDSMTVAPSTWAGMSVEAIGRVDVSFGELNS